MKRRKILRGVGEEKDMSLYRFKKTALPKARVFHGLMVQLFTKILITIQSDKENWKSNRWYYIKYIVMLFSRDRTAATTTIEPHPIREFTQEWPMAYTELIKTLNVSAATCGFTSTALRAGDNFLNKRVPALWQWAPVIESYLGEYMKFHQTAAGEKRFSVHRQPQDKAKPLCKAWKAKAFADRYYPAFDSRYPSPTWKNGCLDWNYGKLERVPISAFGNRWSWMNLNCLQETEGIYRLLGILVDRKQGRQMYYSRAGSYDWMMRRPSPFSKLRWRAWRRLLDQLGMESPFTFKHHYIKSLHTLDEMKFCAARLQFLDEKEIALQLTTKNLCTPTPRGGRCLKNLCQHTQKR